MKYPDFYAQHMKCLVGGRIVDARTHEDDEDDMEIPALLIQCKDRKMRAVFIMADPEGNGPGHPDISIQEKEAQI